jgi:tetratricopeptide (TPR) repeat protein
MKSGDFLTPLSIVLVFIGVIEATLAYRVTALSGTAQMIFVWFMVTFPALVLAGFFYIQITNPLSWYPPSELDRTTIERLQLLNGSGVKFLSTQLLSGTSTTKTSTMGVEASLPPQADKLYQEGQYQEALRLYRAALDAASREGSIAEVAKITANIGVTLSSIGKYEEALAKFQRALEINREIGDRQSEGITLNNIASVYGNLGMYKEAEASYQAALEISRQTLGSEHPDTISQLSNLASLYANMDRLQESEALTQEALALSERVLGHDHPRTATILNNLGTLYRRSGKLDSALTAYQSALRIMESSLGPVHPSTRIVKENIEALKETPNDG